MTDVSVKICGLSTPETVDAAISAGADYIGLVFFPPSPRNVDRDLAAHLIEGAAGRIRTIGLFVNPTDDDLGAVLARANLDLIQLQGRESPERVAEIGARFNKRTVKALPVSEAKDLQAADAYEDVADFLMFDAKPPQGSDRPGGNAAAFDWHALVSTWSGLV